MCVCVCTGLGFVDMMPGSQRLSGYRSNQTQIHVDALRGRPETLTQPPPACLRVIEVLFIDAACKMCAFGSGRVGI